MALLFYPGLAPAAVGPVEALCKKISPGLATGSSGIRLMEGFFVSLFLRLAPAAPLDCEGPEVLFPSLMGIYSTSAFCFKLFLS